MLSKKIELKNLNVDKFDLMTFQLSGIDVSVANALRRTIMADIPTVIIDLKTIEYKTNTTQLNNEIISNRLNCIPIHGISCLDVDDYTLILNEKNETEEEIKYITTNDFKVLHKGIPLTNKEKEKLFPKNKLSNDYILLVRLKKGNGDYYPPEEIEATMKLTCTTVNKSNSCCIVASTISYGFSLDLDEIKKQSILKEKELFNLSKDEKELELRNWLAIEAKRITLKNSFDFCLQTIGVYKNTEIIDIALDVIIQGFQKILEIKELVEIVECSTAMDNSFDIKLYDVDYTLGNVISTIFIQEFIMKKEQLLFCSFSKLHPHDANGLLRIAFKNEGDATKENCFILLQTGIYSCIEIFKELQHIFKQI